MFTVLSRLRLTFGLRDYGTAQWAGGDAACDHAAKQPKRGKAEYTNGQGGSFSSNLQAWGDRDVSTVYRDVCGKCGATRVDRQIGLEASPDCRKRGLFRLRADLTEAQREFVVRRLVSGAPRDV